MNDEQFATLAEGLQRLRRVESSLKEVLRLLKTSRSYGSCTDSSDTAETKDIVDGFQMISSSTLVGLDRKNGSSTRKRKTLNTSRKVCDSVEATPVVNKKRPRPDTNINQHCNSLLRNDRFSDQTAESASTISRMPTRRSFSLEKRQKGTSGRVLRSSTVARVKKELPPRQPLDIYGHRSIKMLSPGDFLFLKPLPTDNTRQSCMKRSFRLCQILKHNKASGMTELQWWETNSRKKSAVSRQIAFFPAWTNANVTKEKYANEPDSFYCNKMWYEINTKEDKNVLLAFPRMRKVNYLPLGVVKSLKALLS